MSETVRRVVVIAAVIAAVGALIAAVATSDTGEQQQVTERAVERLIPGRGELAVRQSRVGIDLAPGFTGVLVINGVEIPEDQLVRTEALNQVVYVPAQGNEIEELQPGEVCVVAIYWRIGEERGDGQSARWCFDVA